MLDECLFYHEFDDGSCICFHSRDKKAFQRLWEGRHTIDSPAAIALRALDDKPDTRPFLDGIFAKSAAKIVKDKAGDKVIHSTRTRDSFAGGPKRRRPLTIDGVQYPSIRQAAAALKISPTALCKRLRKLLNDFEFSW